MTWLKEAVDESSALKMHLVSTQVHTFDAASIAICRAILRGRKVMACGNGGSASDASHFVGEMLGRFKKERASLPAVSLVSDPATVTAIANDYGYDKVFSRQVEGIGQPGDVLLAISTSGKSPNVLEAARTAKRMSIPIVALVGGNKSELTELATATFAVAGSCTARIQEVHIFIIHTLCEMIDRLYAAAPSLLGRSGELSILDASQD